MNNYQATGLFIFSALFLVSCASQLPNGGTYKDSFVIDENCNKTKIEYELIGVANEIWSSRLAESTKIANEVLNSDSFAQICQTTKMNKTLGKSVQEVCREMACSGTKHLKFGFFNDSSTSAIAREIGNGVVEFNIAKPDSGAGGPGNIAHEFTHTLGYKHFTNFSWLGKYSVPYEVGGIVKEISNQ